MVSFGRRSERQFTRALSFAIDSGSDLVLQFWVTWVLKTLKSSNGEHRRNLKRLNKSVSRLEIGVALRLQRLSASRAQTDLAKVFDGSRMIWADKSARSP